MQLTLRGDCVNLSSFLIPILKIINKFLNIIQIYNNKDTKVLFSYGPVMERNAQANVNPIRAMFTHFSLTFFPLP